MARNKQKFQIADESSSKKSFWNSKRIITASAVIAIILGGGVLALINIPGKEPTTSTTQSAEVSEYESMTKEYKKSGVDYTREDYERDKAAREQYESDIKAGVDEATASQTYQNNLSDASKSTTSAVDRAFQDAATDFARTDAEGTGVIGNGVTGATSDSVTQWIKSDVNGYYNWIYGENFGWGTDISDNPDGSKNAHYAAFMDALNSGASSVAADPGMWNPDMSYETMRNWFAQGTFYGVSPTTFGPEEGELQSPTPLATWFKQVPKNITQISIISVTDNTATDPESKIIVSANTNIGFVKISLIPYSDEDGTFRYKVFDIER